MRIGAKWTANPAADKVTAYNLYENRSGQYALVKSVSGTTTNTIIGSVRGTHTYALSAVNATGESLKCADVSFTA